VEHAATLAEVDLGGVLGIAVSAPVAASVVALDVRLDALERGRKRYGWTSSRGPGAGGFRHPWNALGRVLACPAPADDLLELSLDVWRHADDPLEVQASVVVGCFCEEDHVNDTAAEQVWTASTDSGVRDALVSAVSVLEQWSVAGLDPEGWRLRAALRTRAAAWASRGD